jgi:NADH-quinone oxidoreductase subunit N
MQFDLLTYAWPEVILGVGAMALLVWGAFQGKASGLLSAAAVLVLAAAAVQTAIGPLGRAFLGGLVVDPLAVFA